ncbi:hypothetical protein WME88_27675 [Sorangium sp. So ce216]
MKTAAVEAFARALAAMTAELAADLLEQRLKAPSAPRYATAKSNPLGSGRTFLDAARAGRFPSFKRGREVVALWSDVDAYIMSAPRTAKAPPEADAGLEAELAAAATPRRRRAARG